MYGTENGVMSIKTQTIWIMKKMMAAAVMAAVVFSFSAANAQQVKTAKTEKRKTQVKRSPMQTKVHTTRTAKMIETKKVNEATPKSDAQKLPVKKDKK